jgi:hypothetical protein
MPNLAFRTSVTKMRFCSSTLTLACHKGENFIMSILIFLSQMSWANLPYTYFLHSTYQISYPFSLARSFIQRIHPSPRPFVIFRRKLIVTDLINALPGNSSVNTVQHWAIGEAVFFMSSAPSSGKTTGLCKPFRNNGSVNTFPRIRPCYDSGDVIHNRDCLAWGLCRVLIREGSDRIRSAQLDGSRKLEKWVIDGLHLSSEVPREQQCGQKKN